MRQSIVKLWFDDGSCVEVKVSAQRKLVRVDSGVGGNIEVAIMGPPPPPLPKGAKLQALLDRAIEDLGFTVRTTNCLGPQRLDLVYVGELVVKTERDLLKARHFGRKSLDEITAKLAQKRLTIGMQIEDLEGWLPPAPTRLAAPRLTEDAMTKALDTPLSDFSTSLGGLFDPWVVGCLRAHKIELLGHLVQQSAIETAAFMEWDLPRFRRLRILLAEHFGLTLDMSNSALLGWEETDVS